MALNDNDLLLINDSQDGNEAKKIKYSTLKSNINGDSGNDLQAVTDNGNTTTNGATFGGEVTAGNYNDTGDVGALLSATGAVMARAQAGNQVLWNGLNGSTPTSQILGDGSGDFAGNITSGDFEPFSGTGAQTGVGIFSAGVINVVRSGDSGERAFEVYNPGVAEPTISFGANGSAEFASYIKTGSTDHKGGGGNYLSTGEVAAYSTSATSYLWRGWDAFSGSSNTLTSEIKADGSANFAGQVTSNSLITDNGNVKVFLSSGNGGLFIYDSTDLSDPTVVINRDGSAVFMGPFDMQADDFSVIINNAGVNVKVPNDADATYTAFNVLKSSNDGSDASTIAKITGDGGATFDGHVVCGTYAPNSDYIALRGTQLEMGRVTDDDDLAVFSSTKYDGGNTYQNIVFTAGGSATFAGNGIVRGALSVTGTGSDNGLYVGDLGEAIIKKDGSASFATNVTVGGEPFGGNKVGSKLALGSCQATAATNSNDVWLGYVKGTPTATSRIGGDGSAHFAGNVTSDGTIGFTLPDGSTYDIRERIEEAISRLTAIETADLTDDQEHSALLTLIANMSSRITALEAQLAGGN